MLEKCKIQGVCDIRDLRCERMAGGFYVFESVYQPKKPQGNLTLWPSTVVGEQMTLELVAQVSIFDGAQMLDGVGKALTVLP